MKDFLVDKSLFFIKKNTKLSIDKLEIVHYGLQGLYSTLLKFIVTIIIALLLNILKEFLLFLLFYIPIRTFSGGFHANNNKECWLISLPAFLIMPIIIKYGLINTDLLISIFIISFPILIYYSPADTLKKPLLRKKIRIRNKIITLIISLIFTIIIIVSSNIYIISAVILATFWQSIIISPLFYSCFKQPYNNYKKYIV